MHTWDTLHVESLQHLLAIVRVQLRFPQAVKDENQGEEQLCHVIGVHNGLSASLFLGSHLFVENLQPLQDLLVAQGEQGNMLNEGLDHLILCWLQKYNISDDE